MQETHDLTVFDQHESAIAIFAEEVKDLKLTDLEDSKTYKLIQEKRRLVTKTRTTVEKVRKDEKAPLLEAGKAIDTRAKEIIEKLSAIEQPLKLEEKKFEAEKERVKRIAEDEEKKRLRAIQKQFTDIGVTWTGHVFQLGNFVVTPDQLKEASGLKIKSLLKQAQGVADKIYATIPSSTPVEEKVEEPTVAKNATVQSSATPMLDKALDQSDAPENVVAPEEEEFAIVKHIQFHLDFDPNTDEEMRKAAKIYLETGRVSGAMYAGAENMLITKS